MNNRSSDRDHRDLDVESVREIAASELDDIARRGTPGRVNRDLVRALGDCGLLPRLFPRRLGGTSDDDVSAVTLCTLREGIAQISPAAETALACQGLGTYPIVQSAAPELAERVVPDIASGDVVTAFALTEPGGGSDAAALELRAEPDGDGWRLSGEKTWISNAPDADLYTVFARTTLDARARGITAFAVPGDADGLHGEPIELVAPHAIGRLTFDGVRVEADEMIGEVDGGFRVAMRTLDLFRPSVGAFAVGMAQAALDAAVSYAREREAFGRQISEFQAVSHKLADMAVSVETARLLVYEAARAYDDGREDEVTRRSAMAKLYATESADAVVDAAIQIHGARGLEEGHLLAELLGDVRATRIYEGTSEIQRTIIARELLRAAEDA